MSQIEQIIIIKPSQSNMIRFYQHNLLFTIIAAFMATSLIIGVMSISNKKLVYPAIFFTVLTFILILMFYLNLFGKRLTSEERKNIEEYLTYVNVKLKIYKESLLSQMEVA